VKRLTIGSATVWLSRGCVCIDRLPRRWMFLIHPNGRFRFTVGLEFYRVSNDCKSLAVHKSHVLHVGPSPHQLRAIGIGRVA
jgi:hypothetical protein